MDIPARILQHLDLPDRRQDAGSDAEAEAASFQSVVDLRPTLVTLVSSPADVLQRRFPAPRSRRFAPTLFVGGSPENIVATFQQVL